MCAARSIAGCLESLETRTLFAAGDLDATFGGGLVVRDILGGGDYGFAVAVQSDGKVLLAGRAHTGSATGNDFAVIRLNVDGTLDSTFGSGGTVTTHLGSNSDGATSIKVQSDGKIVVAGETLRSGTGLDFALVRYNADGSLDSTFGTSGIVLSDFNGGTDQAKAIALASDGSILVVGSAVTSGLPQFALAKYTAAGQLDSAFGTAGKLTTVFAPGYSIARSVVLAGDGSILVGGNAVDFSGTSDFAAVRYSASGTLDMSFGASGWARVDFGADETAHSLRVQSNGAIVLAGDYYDWMTDQADFAIARISASGSLDSSFAGGKVLTDFDSNYDMATSAEVQSDGKIVVAGLANIGGESRFGLVRFNSDGTTDTSFAGGLVSLEIGAEAVANAMAIDGQGRLVVGGFSQSGNGNYNFAAARVIGKVNVAPTANPGNGYVVEAGGAVQLDGSASFDSDGAVVSYEWDFDYDGTTFDVDASGGTPTFSAAGLSGIVRTIALRVVDDNGATHVATTTVTVNVLPPPPPPPPEPDPTPVPPSPVELLDDPASPGKKILVVTGTTQNDRISFHAVKGGLIEVRMNGKKLGRYANISRVRADGGEGHDVIKAHNLGVAVEFRGGKGNDVLAGSAFSDILLGGDGNDHLYGWKGDDLLIGGAGKDRIHSIWGRDVMIGGTLTNESDAEALRALLAQWTREDLTLQEKLAGLSSLSVVDDQVRDIFHGTPNCDGILTGAGDKVQKTKHR